MVPRHLQFPLLDHLMIRPVALQLVILGLMVLVALAPKSKVPALAPESQVPALVPALLPRRFRVLVLQFQ